MHIYTEIKTTSNEQVRVELDDVVSATVQYADRTVQGQLTTVTVDDKTLPLVITNEHEAIVFSLDSNHMYPRANNKPFQELLLQFKDTVGTYAAVMAPDGMYVFRPVTKTSKEWRTVNTGGNREIIIGLSVSETMKCDVVFASHRSIAVRTPTGTILAFNLPYGEPTAVNLRSTCRNYYLLDAVRTSEPEKG